MTQAPPQSRSGTRFLPGLPRPLPAPGRDAAMPAAVRGLIRHAEIDALTLAHVDCDAFYATVEKRDNPELADKPVIIGGGKRGVVSTCCYIARIHGVRSAMPMFKALDACPDAVVIKPDMEKYARVGREVRRMMEELTPLVQPISIDEAFLDLAGTERLHKDTPARTLARFAARVEAEIGITLSVGLSYCKFLAKVASDLDKPRGFSVIGKEEALAFLGPRPVTSDLGRRQGLCRNAGARRDPQHRAIADHGPGGADAPLWRDGQTAVPSGARRG
jgi:DNA polymerase-4